MRCLFAPCADNTRRQGQWKGSRGIGRKTRSNPKSSTETFVALRLLVDNWRWAGVPFYLRTGKRLPRSVSEVRVHFVSRRNVFLPRSAVPGWRPNSITLRLQPHEGISLHSTARCLGRA